MLNPKWLANAPDDIVELWQESEDEALKEIARQISSYDYFTPTAQHTKQLLSATGATQKSIVSALSKVSGKSQKELLKMMQEAGNTVIQDDTGVYKAADIYKASAIDTEALNLVLKQGTQDTLSEFRKIIQQTAINGSKQVYNCIDRAQMLVSTGVISQDQAVRQAIKSLADHGLDSVVYTDNQGHISQVASLETAVRRAVQTGVNQTAGKISNELADEVGCDLVEVSAHEGARPSHTLWQGKIYSRSGNSKKYPKLSTGTGYGTITGLCGINCRHTFGPWVEGSNRVWSDQELEDLKKPTITYNGKKITEYEASQIQRKIERTIRKWKREKEMLDIAGLDSTEAQLKVQQWRATSEDFADQTGLRRQYERENVYISNAKFKADIDSYAKNGYNNEVRNIGKSVKIPDDCEFLLRADTNFEGKDISEDVLRTINDAIAKRMAESKDFTFDEIKVATLGDEYEKSVFLTDYVIDRGRSSIKLYLNKKYFYGVSLEDLNQMCKENYDNGWWKSKSLEDLVNHEIMHSKIAYHNSFDGANAAYEFLKDEDEIHGFCRFVDNFPEEFLNEVYVAICNGETIDEKYMRVYEKYAKNYLR